MDGHTHPLPSPKGLDRNECKTAIHSLNGTDRAELNQYSCNGSLTVFDRLSSQVQTQKKQVPITVTELNTVDLDVFTHAPNSYDWITGPDISNSTFFD